MTISPCETWSMWLPSTYYVSLTLVIYKVIFLFTLYNLKKLTKVFEEGWDAWIPVSTHWPLWKTSRDFWGTIYVSLTCLHVPFYFAITVGTFVSGEEDESDNILHTKTHSGVLYLNSSILFFLTVSNCSKALSCHFKLMSYKGFDAGIYLSFSTLCIYTKN